MLLRGLLSRPVERAPARAGQQFPLVQQERKYLIRNNRLRRYAVQVDEKGRNGLFKKPLRTGRESPGNTARVETRGG